MDIWHVIVVAIMQGLTEFLPISSSAHLILVPLITGWPDQGLAFDVAVHVGTLAAVMGYFRHSLATIARAWWVTNQTALHSIPRAQATRVVPHADVVEARLGWAVLLGTIPVGLVGLLGKGWIETALRSPLVIAAATIFFGLLLWVADRWGTGQRTEHDMRVRDIIVISLAQALALIPGTSRSGITLTAGLAMGLTRPAAARFSFLLSIPVIALAGGLETLDLLKQTAPVDWLALVIGTLLSAISAYLCIHFFLKFLERMSLLPFVVYRLILGTILIIYFAGITI